jgi:ankyrin repeat protein
MYVHAFRAQMTPTLYADCTNHRGQTALEIAAAREDTPMVKCLMRLGVGRKSVDCSLIRASQFDNVGLVKLLLDAPVIDQKGL